MLTSHPIQYQAPFFRELAARPEINLTVYFCSEIGAEEYFDPGFGKVYKWDIPMLQGYDHIFLKNFSPWPATILREAKNKKYDALIIYGYNALTYWLAFFSAWLTRTPLILKGEADHSQDISVFKRIFKNIILTFLFKHVAAFLYSYKLNKEFFKFYGVPEEKLFFFPSAVDNDFFQKKRSELSGQEDRIKKEVGIKNKNLPIVLFVGKFIPRKRVIDILEAAKFLSGEVKFNILLVGDGPEKENLLKFVEKNYLDNVYFTGFKNQSELPKFYIIADVFVLPSAHDPSPKVINEALNFALPIITSDGVRTARDLIDDGKCGFVYPAGNVKELAQCLLEILKNRSHREKLGQNALKIVSRWSFDEDMNGIMGALRVVAPNF